MTGKMRVVIIHGSYGNPNENWFPWLAGEIRKIGHDAIVPAFPTPENQNIESWNIVFKEQVGKIDHNTILVGHSLGPGFILNLLEHSDVPVRATLLVSGFIGKLGLEDFDKVNASFVCREFKWDRIRQNAGVMHIYNSNDDPYVPLSKGVELAKCLDVKLTVIENGGHINASAGFLAFPKLLEDLRPLLCK